MLIKVGGIQTREYGPTPRRYGGLGPLNRVSIASQQRVKLTSI